MIRKPDDNVQCSKLLLDTYVGEMCDVHHASFKCDNAKSNILVHSFYLAERIRAVDMLL